jgi:hypothetical protein
MNEIVADHLKHQGKLGYAARQKLAHALIKRTNKKPRICGVLGRFTND